ncbi:MAG: class I SAM-dependent methyltransferase [Dermatophilaceae bacterium]
MVADRDWAASADRLAVRAITDGEPTRWYEELWSAAADEQIDVPWDRAAVYPPVADFVDALGPAAGRRAVVVGAALGSDAEHLAARGFATVAFDVSPSAVALARGRHPRSAVDYRVADLLDPAPDLRGAFDVVVEVFTVQALHPSLRAPAGAGLRALLAPGGAMVVVQVVRETGTPSSSAPPWLLDEHEVRALAADDVVLESLVRRPHPHRPDGPPMWVAILRRGRGAG